MILYKTIYDEAETELEINKSKFITNIRPVNGYEEAQEFISEIKIRYKDATHNVPALVCGEKQNIQWASDDGEPSGTSGPPILKMMVSLGLTNSVIVVTRYFGGKLLGTGGLVRAYSESARKAIDTAGIGVVKEKIIHTYIIDYPMLGKISNAEKDGLFNIISTEYRDKVSLELSVDRENSKALESFVQNICSGRELLTKSRVERIKERLV